MLDYVREYGRDRETLNFIYVVDDRGKLIDDVRMREFLLRPLTAKVSDIRDRNFAALNATDSQQDALNFFRKYDRAALPVVDSNGVLVGIVTSDDMCFTSLSSAYPNATISINGGKKKKKRVNGSRQTTMNSLNKIALNPRNGLCFMFTLLGWSSRAERGTSQNTESARTVFGHCCLPVAAEAREEGLKC